MKDPYERFADILIIGAIIAVIVLKIVGVIKIAWIWLFSPIWILFLAGMLLAIGLTISCILYSYINEKKEKKENERN